MHCKKRKKQTKNNNSQDKWEEFLNRDIPVIMDIPFIRGIPLIRDIPFRQIFPTKQRRQCGWVLQKIAKYKIFKQMFTVIHLHGRFT